MDMGACDDCMIMTKDGHYRVQPGQLLWEYVMMTEIMHVCVRGKQSNANETVEQSS